MQDVLFENDEFVGPPKPERVIVRVLVSSRDTEVALQIVERMALEKFDGKDVVFVITKEDDRRGAIALVDHGGVFGYLPAIPRPVLESNRLVIDDGRELTRDFMAAFLASEACKVAIPDLHISGTKPEKRAWPVDRYGPLVRKGASVLRQSIRSKQGKRLGRR
jgi:hypothetical protein